MRSAELSKRNMREVWRDPLSLGLTIGLPVVMLLVLQAFGDVDAFFSPTSLTPGIALFGFVMLMFSASMILSRDRETALFARLLTTPLRSSDFTAAYSIPFIAVAIVQAIVLFAIGAVLGLENNGSAVLVFLLILAMATLYVGLGIIFGSLFSLKQVPFLYAGILLLTIFGGAWIDLQAIGGAFQTIAGVFPFAHALDAVRAVMIDGADFGTIATDVYWVLGYTIVVVGLSVVAFRHKMQE